jgi:hypothetical protein
MKQLVLVSARKSRVSGQWRQDDCDARLEAMAEFKRYWDAGIEAE